MKLSEALISRADAKNRLSDLRSRMVRSAIVQEGDQPPEDPADLLQELDRILNKWTALVKAINHTNVQTPFANGDTLTDALAERDRLATKQNMLDNLIQAAAVHSQRYTRAEIKFVSTVDIQALQKEKDALAKAYRELDTKIQELNWTTDLIEP